MPGGSPTRPTDDPSGWSLPTGARGRPNGQPGVQGRARRTGGGPRPTGRRGPGRAARDPGRDRPGRRGPQGDRYFELVVSCGHVAQPTSPRSSRAARAPAGCDVSAAVPARTRSPRAARGGGGRVAPQSARARAAARPPASARRRRRRRRDPRARIADLAYLVEQLKAIHPDPFLDEGEAGFMARVARIEAAAPSLTDVGFLVAVMDLMGHRERDGHSGAWAMAQSGRCSPPGLSGCGTSPTGCVSSPRATRMRTWSARGSPRSDTWPSRTPGRRSSRSSRATTARRCGPTCPPTCHSRTSCASSASSPPAIRV